MRAAAFVHGPNRIHEMGRAFVAGCKKHGVKCDLLPAGVQAQADVVWLYGLGPALPAFQMHPDAVRLVGDKGYFSEYTKGQKRLRVSVNAQQPDDHLRLVDHPGDRWRALGINVKPVESRGDYILVTGIGPKQCERHGLKYGQWERETVERLNAITTRPVVVREKPGNSPIDGVQRLADMPASVALRGAWAVVCMTGNIGVDAILEGVPVIAEGGPGKVYYQTPLESIDTIQPLNHADRQQALYDIAYWQWTLDEIRRGYLWDNLRREGFF